MKIRMLYLITRSERGGGQAHVLDLLRGYSDKYDCLLATGEPGYLCDQAGALGVPTRYIRGLVQPISPVKDLIALLCTVRLIWSFKPHVIHAHTSKAGLVARLAGAMTGTPVVYTVHMWSFTEGLSKWRHALCVPIERLCARFSARTITVSEANRQLGIRLKVGDQTSLTTVRNGVPDVKWRSNPKSGGPVRIVMVARFAAPKDQRLLTDALSKIESDFELLFVGSGPGLSVIKAAVERLNLGDRVKFLMDRDDVPEILATAQIFVLTSHWEGLPLSILEAMRAGLPVIASDVGGVSEAVAHQQTGLLVPPGDVLALSRALQQLISDPLLRSRLGIMGRRRYENEFSIGTMLFKTGSIYDEVLENTLESECLDAKAA